MDVTTLALNRLAGILHSGAELSTLLKSIEERARAVGVQAGLAAEDPRAGHHSATLRFLFVCAVRLGEIASAAARGAAALGVAESLPTQREEWTRWVRRVEREAAQTAATGRELQQLSTQASLLALEANLTAWEPAQEIAGLAEQLRQASRSVPAWAAETMWAAEDASRQLAGGPNEK